MSKGSCEAAESAERGFANGASELLDSWDVLPEQAGIVPARDAGPGQPDAGSAGRGFANGASELLGSCTVERLTFCGKCSMLKE